MSWNPETIRRAIREWDGDRVEDSMFCGDYAVLIQGGTAWYHQAAADWQMMTAAVLTVEPSATPNHLLRQAHLLGHSLNYLCLHAGTDFYVLEPLRHDNFDSRWRLGGQVNLTELVRCLVAYREYFREARVQCNWSVANHYRVVVFW